MFGKNKILTYNPKDYKDQFSESQKKDLNLTNNIGVPKNNLIGNVLNKKIGSENDNCITGWANKLDSYINEKIKGFLESENIVVDKDIRKLLENIAGIKPKIKLLILAIIFLFLIANPVLIIFAIFIIIWIIGYTIEAAKKEELRKQMEKERQEM